MTSAPPQLGDWPGEIIVAADGDTRNRRAAQLFASIVSRAAADRGRAMVALSGGNTPRALYRLLAQPEWRDRIPWDKLHVFWSDERYLPPTDPQSNFRVADEALLSRVPIPSKNIHRFLTEQGTAEEVASDYEQAIRDAFDPEPPRFDLVLLGLGSNAHTASLFPFSDVLRMRERLVAADFIEEVNGERLTFLPALINSAQNVLFLVNGAEKSEVVRDVISSPYEPERLPAQLIRPHPGSLTWLLDAPAARLVADISQSA